MAKNTATFLLDGKKVKQIEKVNKKGEEIWTKFKPLEGVGFSRGMHFISGKPQENHFDIYLNGQDTDIKDKRNEMRSAGICIHLGKKETKYITLPPVEVSEEDARRKGTDIERIRDYFRRVKILDPNK